MYKRLVFENLLFVVIRYFASTLKVSLTGYIIQTPETTCSLFC